MAARPPAAGLPQGFGLSAFLFNAAGRSGRRAYFFGCIVPGVLLKTAYLLPPGAAALAWAWIVWPGGFVIWGVLTSRRLHDLGRAGWWFAPMAGLFLLGGTRFPLDASPLSWACWSVLAAASLCLFVLPGERRFNRFGPPPG